MKKVIKIDVQKKSVYHVEINRYSDIYEEIGNGCQLFCVPVTFANNDGLYSDDEGLLHEEMIGCFIFDDWDYPLVGNALIVGTDDGGNSQSCSTSIDDILKKITFYDASVAERWKEAIL